MSRYILLVFLIAAASCSSKRVTPKPAGGASIAELRVQCKQGNSSACRKVQANDSML